MLFQQAIPYLLKLLSAADKENFTDVHPGERSSTMENRRAANPAQFQEKLLPYRSNESMPRNRNPGLRINDLVFRSKDTTRRTKDRSPGFRHRSPVLRSPVRDDCLLIMCLGENRKKVLWRKHDPRRVLFKWKVCYCRYFGCA